MNNPECMPGICEAMLLCVFNRKSLLKNKLRELMTSQILLTGYQVIAVFIVWTPQQEKWKHLAS